jgi:hypothetical protein
MDSTPNPTCPQEESAEPFLQKELAVEEAVRFLDHLESCSVCAEAVASAKEYAIIFRQASVELDPLLVATFLRKE